MKKYIAGFMALTVAASTLFSTTIFASSEIVVAVPRVIGVKTLGQGETSVGMLAGWTQGSTPASATAPELRLEIRDTKHLATSDEDIVLEFTLALENAEFKGQVSEAGVTPIEYDSLTAEDFVEMVVILNSDGSVTENIPNIEVKDGNFSKDEVTFTLTTAGEDRDTHRLRTGNVIVVDLASVLQRSASNMTAIVNVESNDMGIESTDIVYAQVIDRGFTATIRGTDQVAIDESVVLSNRITIKETVSGSFVGETPAVAETEESEGTARVSATEFTFQLSKGFAFVNPDKFEFDGVRGLPTDIDADKFTIEIETVDGEPVKEFSIRDMEIEATTAKIGDVASIKITSKNLNTVSLEVAEVVDYTVILSVDQSKDVPVMFSGVDAKSTGLTLSSDATNTLEIQIEESFPGAWSMRDGFDFTLPEGVYVTDVNVLEVNNFLQDGELVSANEFEEVMKTAYINGKYEGFNFKRRSFDDVDHTLATDKAKVTFQLTLVAEPDFEGEVEFGFEGSLLDTQTVVVAEFMKPFTVSAEQNDVIIDYRNTKIDTAIVVKETEAGILGEGATINFSVDRGDYIQFERGASFTVSEESDMEVKGSTDIANGILSFEVVDESYDKPATVTIDGMELFMQRSIPAGAYDLTVSSSMEEAFLAQDLFGEGTIAEKGREDLVGDYTSYSKVVNKAFVNVVTAGSDKDNTFTTKIVVPIGEMYITAGTKTIELDVPAYISPAGFTMLPVRAVANALGVDTNSVLWNDATKSVTIMYGQRIITMQVGQNYLTINGSVVPTSTAPEIKDGRSFLPLRDLAVALGVSDIHWDPDNRTATLNGGEGVNTVSNEEATVEPTVVAPINLDFQEEIEVEMEDEI